MKRTLRLRKDPLADLTDAELVGVEGGAATLPVNVCPLTQPCTLGYDSCRACITHPPCTI